MSLLLAAALAAGLPMLPSCSWDRPGVNPYRGSVVAAVDRYTDIPAPVRARLKQRMEARQYDDIADIRRDSITGKARYGAQIRDMHFGQGTVCRTVTRSRWTDSTMERGLVYCESGHCLIVPTVCNNVSRITRLHGKDVAADATEATDAPVPRGVAGLPGGAAGSGAAPAGDGTAQALAAPAGEAPVDPQGAGPSFAEAAQPAAPAVSELNPGGNGSGSFAGGVAGGGSGGSGGGGPVTAAGSTPFPATNPGRPGVVSGPPQPLTPLFGLEGGGVAQPIGVPVPPREPGVTPLPPLPPLPDTLPPLLPDAIPAIPEPGTWALMAAGLAVLGLRARRRA